MNKILIKLLTTISFLYLITLCYMNVKIDDYKKDIIKMQNYVKEVQSDIDKVNDLMNDLSIKLDDINNKIPQ